MDAAAAHTTHQAPASRLKIRIPHLSTGLVQRVRLRAVLEQERTEAGVVLVTGPPGAGKTTLLADWARRTEDVAWVTLDDGDDLTDVWDALLAAFGRLAGPGTPVLHRPPADAVDPSFVAAVVETIVRIDRPLHLVLDEVEHLVAPAAVRSIDLLLRWAPPSLRVVLAGRTEPPLALGRLRVAGRLRELRARDLAFTSDEANALLAGRGLVLDAESLHTLMRCTEGWAAGLRLVAMSMESAADRDAVLADLAVAQPAVADYLVGELLARQPASVIDFLLRTSICDRITPELAAGLSGREDAGEILENLCRANALTLRLGGSRRPHYRYHRMLREYLQAELGRRCPAAAVDLHRRAAAWYAVRDDVRRGIAHAAAAGDVDRMVELVDQGGLGLVLSGQARTVERLLAETPAEVLAQPPVRLVAAVAALERGDVDRADAVTPDVDQLAGAAGAVRLLAVLELQRARYVPGSPDHADLRRLLERADAPGGGVGDVELFRLLVRGPAHLLVGNVDRAEADLHRARRLAVAGGRDHAAVRCLSALAWVAAVGGGLERAHERAAAALGDARDRGWEHTPVVGHAHLAQAFVSYLRMDDAGARVSACAAEQAIGAGADPAARFATSALRVMAQLGGTPGDDGPGDRRARVCALRTACTEFDGPLDPPVVAFVASALQRLCLDLGEPRWADESVGWAAARLGGTAEAVVLAAGARVHRGRLEGARRMLGPVVEGELRSAGALTLIEAWLLEAVLADAGDRAVRTHQALSEAVRLAEPEAVARPFRDGGRVVRGLLSRHAGRFGRGEPFVKRLLAADPPVGFGPTERLSVREQEILRELESLRTAEGIAVDLGVSVNTVKTHMRAVYRKLQVSTRRDAVAAGRRHALL